MLVAPVPALRLGLRALLADSGHGEVNNSSPNIQTYFPGYPSYPPQPGHFIPVTIEDAETKTYHGVGPGLELEVDTVRTGPFMMSLFLAGKAYRVLGDREVVI